MSDRPADSPDDEPVAALLEIDETVIVTAGATDEDLRGMSAAPQEDIKGMSAVPQDDIQGMSYEAARDALADVVDQLERGGTTLEQTLALWERGEALAARCETWLIGARARLDAARAAEA